MDSLVTTAELAAWMQVPEGSLPDGADIVLSLASDTVRAAAGCQFTRATSTVDVFPQCGVAVLPQRPVVGVSAVVADGAALGADDYELRRDSLFVDFRVRRLTVTFEHGYSTPPGNVKAVVLDLCSRLLSNTSGLKQLTVGSINYTFDSVGSSLSQIERDSLSKYRMGATSVRYQ